MIPRITRGGNSFKGAFAYYLHDKGASTSHRVAWTQVENMLTQDPEKAWKVMAFTVEHRGRLKEASGRSKVGRKLEKPVFAFSLAWHPERAPTQEHMLETAREAVAMLGLSEHEAVIVAHNDEPQQHVHVIVNRVHPITGIAANLGNSKRKFSDFALAYERKDGKIYCQQREANAREREAGKKTRYADPHLKDAWKRAATGSDFLAAIQAKGYVLAQGRKRLVVVDPHGKAHNPTRHLPGIRAKDLHALLKDVDLNSLPDANAVQAKMQFRNAARQDKTAPQPDKPDAKPAQQAQVQARLDALHNRHKEEQEDFRQQHRRRMEFTKERLVTFHSLPQRKARLVALRQQIRQAPWWKRLLGITRNDRKKFDEQAQQYRRDLEKCRQKFDALKRQAREDWRTLKARQVRECDELAVGSRTRSADFGNLVNQKEVAHGHLASVFAQPPAKVVARHSQTRPQDHDRGRWL
jgi:hypothetical protein